MPPLTPCASASGFAVAIVVTERLAAVETPPSIRARVEPHISAFAVFAPTPRPAMLSPSAYAFGAE